MASVEFPALEISCEPCFGSGKLPAGGNAWVECEHCEGRGRLLTGLGAELLDFLDRWRPSTGQGAEGTGASIDPQPTTSAPAR
jgi:DnaJ-class molecular chaperone